MEKPHVEIYRCAILPLIAAVATLCNADEPAKRLNGTWEYVASIESDGITSYDKSLSMRPVILNDTWALFRKGVVIQGTVENVQYNSDSKPVSFVRRKGPTPHAVGHGILKVFDTHLMYTITPMDATGFGSSSGAVDDFSSTPRAIDSEGKELAHRMNLGGDRLYDTPPKSFCPEGTSNTQYILKRIDGSTTLMSQITKR